jgi:hypothetical protein
MKKIYQKPVVEILNVTTGAMMAGSNPTMTISQTPTTDGTHGDSRESESSSLWEDGSEEQQ